jgi:DNA-binding transcriptional regulator YdaS (Cro superfamily)
MGSSNGFGSASERLATLKAHRGILSRIAGQLGMSTAAVSRTYHGVTRQTNPRIVEAIRRALAEARKAKEVRLNG